MGYVLDHIYPWGGACCGPSFSGLEEKIIRSDNNVLLCVICKIVFLYFQTFMTFLAYPVVTKEQFSTLQKPFYVIYIIILFSTLYICFQQDNVRAEERLMLAIYQCFRKFQEPNFTFLVLEHAKQKRSMQVKVYIINKQGI